MPYWCLIIPLTLVINFCLSRSVLIEDMQRIGGIRPQEAVVSIRNVPAKGSASMGFIVKLPCNATRMELS